MTMKKNETAASLVFGVVLLVGLMFFGTYVLLKTWQWHVTPWLGLAVPPFWTVFALGSVYMTFLGPGYADRDAAVAEVKKNGVVVPMLSRAGQWGMAFVVSWACA